MRRAAWLLLASVLAVGVLLLFVFPGRTLLTQDHEISSAQHAIRALDREDSLLRQEDRSLHDSADVERIASQRFGLVLPHQRAYDITAPPAAPRVTPRPAKKAVAHHGWWQYLELWNS